MKRLFLILFSSFILCDCSGNPTPPSLASEPSNSINRLTPRSAEEIQLIFQSYKGAITQMYVRARRENPALKGKVVFEMVIEPSGAVSACRILSSEMDAPDLLEKIVDKIRTINFGIKDQLVMTINFPFEFIQSDKFQEK